MSRSIVDEQRRTAVRRLRQEERLSLKEISARTGTPPGTLSAWLKDIPLSKEEQAEKASTKRRAAGPRPLKTRPPDGRFAHIDTSDWSSNRKGAVAEAAIALRLEIHGINAWRSFKEGAEYDFLVQTPTGLKKLQVRWARTKVKHSLPIATLLKSNGRGKSKRWTSQDLDFLALYDLRSDTAYVFTEKDIERNRHTITVRDEAAERWDKISK